MFKFWKAAGNTFLYEVNKERIILLKKYLISSIVSGLFFSALSWIIASQRGPFPTFYYLLPIVLVSVLIYLFYFKRLTGYYNKNGDAKRGGAFFVALVYFSGIIVTSMAAVKMTDEFDQKVTALETPDQIWSDRSEYVRLNHYQVKREEMLSGFNYSAKLSKGVTTNKFDFWAYVPLEKKPGDSISRLWIDFRFRISVNGNLSEEGTKHFQDTNMAKYNSLIKHLNYDSIIFFSKRISQYSRLPDIGGGIHQEIIMLTPSFTSLEGELKDDEVQYSLFYAGSIIFFIVALMFVEKRVETQR